MDHGVVEKPTWVEEGAFPPGQGLNGDDLGGGFHLFDPCGGVAEHAGAGINRLPIGAKGKRHRRRPLASDVSRGDLAVRFILRGEVVRVWREARENLVQIHQPALAGFRVKPVRGLGIFLIVEPIRECEVPEADDRLDARRFQTAGHLDITVQRLLVELAHARLDARPLKAESVMGDTCLFQGGEVFFKMGPGVKGITLLRRATLRNHDVPIRRKIIRVAGFHRRVFVLVTGCGNAPGKLRVCMCNRARRPRHRSFGIRAERVETAAGCEKTQRQNRRNARGLAQEDRVHGTR